MSYAAIKRQCLALHQTLFSWTAVKFGITGFSGVFVNLGSFSVLLKCGLHPFLASPAAILLSILSNFLINNYWTFASTGRFRDRRLTSRGLKYLLVATSALLISYGTFVALTLAFPAAWPVLLQACGIPVAMLYNYIMSVYWVFSTDGE